MIKSRIVVAATVVSMSIASFARCAQIEYSTVLSGAAQDPPVASPGTGTALVTVDTDLNTMRLQTSFSDLIGNVTVAHIHCCTADPLMGNAGVATPTPTFPDFPVGVTSGSYDMTFDLADTATYNATFITNNGGTVEGARSALLSGLDQGRAYLNIHSTFAGSGEIRGFLVPEPSAWMPILIGLGVTFARSRRPAAGNRR